MRKQLLGAAALTALAGGLVLPVTPAQASSWKPITAIPFPAGTVTDVDVVSTGPGDAVAAAIIDGAVHAYTATNGTWTTHTVVSTPVGATGLVLAGNGSGGAVVGWEQSLSGDNRLRARRTTGGGAWSATQTLTPAGTDVTGTADLGMAGNGLVIAAATLDGQDIDNRLVVTEWKDGEAPGAPKTLSPGDAWNPALDVNAKGAAVVAYQYTGLIDDVLDVHRRAAGGGWSLGKNAGNSGDIAAPADVAISDNGSAQLIWSSVVNGFYVAETSRVKPDGTVVHGGLVSPLDEYANDPSVDIDADGTALFAWQTVDGGVEGIRYAAAADNASPASSVKLPGTLADAADPTARIGDHGLRVIQYTANGQVATHHRVGVAQQFASTTSGGGFTADDAVDVDSEGNAVMVGIKTGAGVYGRFLDASGPTVAMTGPQGANQLATTFPVSWTATDTLSPVAGATVISRESAWNAGGFTDAVAAVNALASPADFSGEPGTTYCLSVQAKDTAGNLSQRTSERCTTLPLDDVSLAGGKAWQRTQQPGQYLGTVSRTDDKGAVLTRTGVKAKRIALVVQKSANGGRVRVTFGGKDLGTVSLHGTGKKKLVPITTFDSVRSGTLRLTVVSPDGKQVAVDGVVLAK